MTSPQPKPPIPFATGLRPTQARRPFLHPTLDPWLGGLHRITEISGPSGSGRLGILWNLLAQRPFPQGSPQDPPQVIAVLDPGGTLNPGSLPEPQRILYIRPGLGRLLWISEQVLSSGAAALVLLFEPGPLSRPALRLLHAAEAGNTPLIVINRHPDPDLPALLRLQTEAYTFDLRLKLHCTRGPTGERWIPPV